MNHSDYLLCDAHTHIGTDTEIQERSKRQIRSLVCASTPAEAERLQQYKSFFIMPTYGLHPWHADKYRVSEMSGHFENCTAIGEIGMDNVWCDVPLSIQETVFTKQLAIASELQKPVILHTKGQEEKCGNLIKKYKNTYMVHWYSAQENPLDYFSPDCYFSIGPDVWWNHAMIQVVSCIPLNHLLIETDGMNAVKWAYTEAPDKKRGAGFPTPPASVFDALTDTLQKAAAIRGLSPAQFGKQIEKNFNTFLREPAL